MQVQPAPVDLKQQDLPWNIAPSPPQKQWNDGESPPQRLLFFSTALSEHNVAYVLPLSSSLTSYGWMWYEKYILNFVYWNSILRVSFAELLYFFYFAAQSN